MGLDPDRYEYKTHNGFTLNSFAEANYGMGKTGNGGLAPVLWQQGKRGEVIDYCLNDVYLTKLLFDKIIRFQILFHERAKNGHLNLRHPLLNLQDLKKTGVLDQLQFDMAREGGGKG